MASLGRSAVPEWRRGLAGPSLRIVESNSRYVHILAGPGTGKTFTMMRRIARFLEQGNDPSRILVVTFTRTAAYDLRKKLEQLCVTGSDRMTASTLHGLCYSMLKRKEVLKATGRVPRTLFPYEEEYLLRDLGAGFGNLRTRRRMLEAYLAGWSRLQHGKSEAGVLNPGQDFVRALDNWLRFHDAMLVGELVPLIYDYLSTDPNCSDVRKYNHVFVDEYQDLNLADLTVIDMLAKEANLTVAGDDLQSIYGFRFAHPQGVIDFPKAHPGTHSETLTDCRRCPKRVIEIANRLMQSGGANPSRHLCPCTGAKEGEVDILRWTDPDEEASGICRIIKCYLRVGCPVSPGDILVLTPRKSLAAKLRQEMTRNSVRTETALGEQDLFEGAECQERISLLQLLVNPNDKAALRCWLGAGSSSFLSKSYKQVRDVCESDNISPKEILDQLRIGGRKLPGATSLLPKYARFLEEMGHLKNLCGKPLLDAWLPEDVEGLLPLRALLDGIVSHDTSCDELLSYITDYLARPEAPMCSSDVRIMTLHKAKGLEAHTVIILGLVDGLLPSHSDGPDQAQIEEQRRLLYVAMTRAKARLLLSTWASASQKDVLQLKASNTRWVGKGVLSVCQSRFLSELGSSSCRPENGLEFVGRLEK